MGRDLRLTYTPAFRECVQRGGAAEVMCSYNAVNGFPMCANKQLLGGLLRDSWNFSGLVVSDCGAVDDVAWGHHFKECASSPFPAPPLPWLECAYYGLPFWKYCVWWISLFLKNVYGGFPCLEILCIVGFGVWKMKMCMVDFPVWSERVIDREQCPSPSAPPACTSCL